jgi:uncharacterized protein YcbK (DUF882 family)
MINFTHSEFDSPDEPGSGAKMDQLFLNQLDDARSIAGVPFIINSGYRSVSHNVVVGGKIGSSHTKGCAADIKVMNSLHRFLILNALINVGVTRIGIGDTFIHADSDKDKVDKVIWLYT